jgi:hypothetical protein
VPLTCRFPITGTSRPPMLTFPGRRHRDNIAVKNQSPRPTVGRGLSPTGLAIRKFSRRSTS